MRQHMLSSIASRLDEAALSATPVTQLSEAISVQDAYEVQRLSVLRRIERGERRLGIKMGLTSKAKMAQVGVKEMTWGRLTDEMLIEEGGHAERSRFIHPRAEAEIAFLIGKPLAGKVTLPEAFAAIDGVAAAIEIIDSRYKDFKFSLTDVIADNSSSSAFAVGHWNPSGTDVANLGMTLEFDGRPISIGSSAAILGHPMRSVVAAAALLARYGDSLQPGDVLLSGAATAAEPLKPGTRVRVRVEKLGACGFYIS